MSEVIKLDSNEWMTDSNDSFRTTKLQFKSSTRIFNVSLKRFDISGSYVVTATVTPESNTLISQSGYSFEYQLCLTNGLIKKGTLTEADPTTEPLNVGHWTQPFPNMRWFKLTFNAAVDGLSSNVVYSYIQRGPTVTLIGHDGNVTVPKRLLKIWSSALEVMFNHNSMEKQTGEIVLKDFDAATLTAFAHFLMTGRVEDGKATALGLVLLGDKYDIQPMKEAAETFIKNNIRDFNKENVLAVFSAVCPKLLFDAMDSWSK